MCNTIETPREKKIGEHGSVANLQHFENKYMLFSFSRKNRPEID